MLLDNSWARSDSAPPSVLTQGLITPLLHVIFQKHEIFT